MSTIRNILKNTIVLGAGTLIVRILQMVFIAVFARYVGAQGIGKFAFAISTVSVFLIFINMGLDTLLTREIAKDYDKTRDLTSNIFSIKLLLSIFIFFALVGFLFLRKYDSITSITIGIVAFFLFFDSLANTMIAVFRGFEKMEYESLVAICTSIVYVSAGLLAIYLKLGFIWIVFFINLAYVFKLFLSYFIAIKKFTNQKIKLTFYFNKGLLKAGISFGVLAILGVIYSSTDIIMLKEMVGEQATGWYSAAQKLLNIVWIIPSLFMTAIFPVFSRYSKSSADKMKISYEKTYYYLFTLALPLAMGFYILGDKITLLIYGSDFNNTGIILKILSLFVIWNFVGIVNGNLLLAVGRQAVFAKITAIGAFSNIFLNYIFIKQFGYLGVCYSTLIASTAGLIIYSIMCHRILEIHFKYFLITKAFLITLFMGVIIYFLNVNNVNIFLIIFIIAPFIYFSSGRIFNVFSKDDILLIKNSLIMKKTPIS